MLIVVEVNTRETDPPPAGTPVHVEVRDTSLADAPAITLGRADGEVRGRDGWLETLELEVDEAPPGTTVWVHVDADRDGRVSSGDFLTTASYEVPPGGAPRVAAWVTRI